MNELLINATFNYNKNGGAISCSVPSPPPLRVSVAGNNSIKNILQAGVTDATLHLGGIATLGYIWLHSLGTAGVPPLPVIGVITQGGTPGAATWAYRIVANFGDGSLSVSTAVATATGAATLNSTNYNIIPWSDVGATSYDIYRTTSGGTPSTLGKIATGVTSPYNDQGAAGDASSVPSAIVSNYPIIFGPDGTVYPNELWAGEVGVIRWRGAAIHRKALALPTWFEYALIEK